MKLTSILVLLVLSLVVVGCSRGGSNGPPVTDFKTGIKELNVLTAGFPQTVYQNNRFQARLTLKNDAGYDAENIKVSLVGLDRNAVDVTEQIKAVDSLPGRTMLSPEGSESLILFDGTVKPLIIGQEMNNQKFLILVSYSSKVEFSPTICVDSGLYSVGSGCDFKEVKPSDRNSVKLKSFSGQGAPIQFTNLQVIPYTGTNSELELRMKISDQGHGNVKSLRLGTAVLGGVPLVCEFKGSQVLQPERVEFVTADRLQEMDLVCSGRLDSSLAYESALFVELYYDYQFTEHKTLEIRR